MRHTREPKRVKELILEKKKLKAFQLSQDQLKITLELKEIQILCARINVFLYKLDFIDILDARFFLKDLLNYWKQNRKNKRG